MILSPFIPLSSSLPLIHLSCKEKAGALCSDRNKWSLITTRRPCSTMTQHFHSLPKLCVFAVPVQQTLHGLHTWPLRSVGYSWKTHERNMEHFFMFINCITSGWSIFPSQVSQNSKVSFPVCSVRWKANKSVGRQMSVTSTASTLCSQVSVGTGVHLHDWMEKEKTEATGGQTLPEHRFTCCRTERENLKIVMEEIRRTRRSLAQGDCHNITAIHPHSGLSLGCFTTCQTLNYSHKGLR